MAVEIGTAYVSLTAEARDLAKSITKQLTGAEKVARQAGQRSADAFSGSFGSTVKKVAAIAAGLFGTKKLIDFGRAAFGAAAQVGELNVAMEAVGKSTGLGYMALQSTALAVKKNGIEMATAQQMALQFAQANLDLGKAAGIARVAQDLAVIAQKNSTEVTDLLTDAIMTQNTRLLRSAGITKSAEEAYQAYAAANKVAAADLTEAQKKQAIMNMVLEEGAKVAGTYEAAMKEPGKVLRSFPRLFNDMAVAIGKPLVDAFGPVVLGVYKAVKAFTEGEKIKDIVDRISGALTTGKQAVSDFLDRVRDSGMLQQFGSFFADIGAAVAAALPTLREIGETVAGVVFGAFQALADVLANYVGPALKEIGKWIGEHKTLVTALAIGLGGAVVAYKTYTTVVNAAKAAQALFNTVMAMNPIGVVVTIIAALAAGLIYAYQKSETFRDIVNTAFRLVAQVVGDVVGSILRYIRLVLSAYMGLIDGMLRGAATLTSWIPGLGDGLREAQQMFTSFKDGVLGTLEDLANQAYGWGEAGGSNFANGFTKGSAAAFRAGEQASMQAPKPASGYSSSSFRKAEEASKARAKELGVGAGQTFASSFTGSAGKATGGKAAEEALSLKDYVTIATNLGKQVTESLAKGLILGKTTLTNALGELVDKLDGAAGKIRDRINEMAQAAQDYAKKAADSVMQIANLGSVTWGKFGADFASIRKMFDSALAYGKEFTQNLKSLQGLGLRQDLIDQLVQAGPEKGLLTASVILSGGKAQVEELNRMQAELSRVAGQYGEFATTAQYEKQMVDELRSLKQALTSIPGPIGQAVAKALNGVAASSSLARVAAVPR